MMFSRGEEPQDVDATQHRCVQAIGDAEFRPLMEGSKAWSEGVAEGLRFVPCTVSPPPPSRGERGSLDKARSVWLEASVYNWALPHTSAAATRAPDISNLLHGRGCTISVLLVREPGIGPGIDGLLEKILTIEGFEILGSSRWELTEGIDAASYDLAGSRLTTGAAYGVRVLGDLNPLTPATDDGRRIDWDNARLAAFPTLRDTLLHHVRRTNDPMGGDPENPRLADLQLTWTTNSYSACRIMERLAYQDAAGCASELLGRKATLKTPFPIIRALPSRRNHAVTYLVRHEGRRRVCKVYRPGGLEYKENEVIAESYVGPSPEARSLVASGDNWILMPYYAGYRKLRSVTGRGGLLPLETSRRIFRKMCELHDQGLMLLDFHPDNVLIDGNGALKFIDFEHIHIDDPGKPVREYPAMREDDDVLEYEYAPSRICTHGTHWYPLTGVPFAVLMGESSLGRRAYRNVYVVGKALRKIGRHLLRPWSRRRRPMRRVGAPPRSSCGEEVPLTGLR
jgi:hypothetical protein